MRKMKGPECFPHLKHNTGGAKVIQFSTNYSLKMRIMLAQKEINKLRAILEGLDDIEDLDKTDKISEAIEICDDLFAKIGFFKNAKK